MLVGGVKRLRTNDGQLSLVCSDRNITKIFEITGLDRVFTIHATRDEAVGGAELVGAHAELVRRGGALLALATALLAAGCGTGGISKSGDTDKGKTLFLAKCSGCHTLADAGSHGNQGPNLDDAFAYSRKQGFKQETIEQVVRDQIELAVPPMPQNLVKGADADAVAAYVAMVAGKPVAGEEHDQRQGHLHRQLRQLPHAQGRRHERDRRAEPRPAEAEPRDRPAAGDQRRRRDAGLQGHAHARRRSWPSRSTSPRSPAARPARRGPPRRGGSAPRSARARCVTTPRSSQFERPSGCVEITISSAPKVRSASSIACSGSPSPTSPLACDAVPPPARPRLRSSRSCAAARAGSSSEARWRSGEFSAGLTTSTLRGVLRARPAA